MKEYESIVEEIRQSALNVPFNMSTFQNQVLSCNQETDERKYRHAVLQMNVKLNALQETKFRKDRTEVDIEEIKEKLEDQSLSKFDRKRLEIDLEEKIWGLKNSEKLIEDAIIEVTDFYQVYSSIKQRVPELTRDGFELSELKYYQRRFMEEGKRQALATGSVNEGTLHSLQSVGICVGRNETGGITFSPVEDNVLKITKSDQGDLLFFREDKEQHKLTAEK